MPDIRLTTTPKIAIVGRANVGKSTLFNKLLGERKAITSSIPGTTTDANYGSFQWNNLTMTAIDTAGLDLTADEATDAALLRQAKLALAKSDLVLFVVESTTGLLAGDRSLAKHLQKQNKPVVFLMGKADNPRDRALAENAEWLKLGFGKPMAFSAANGSGIGDFLDEVVKQLKAKGLTGAELPKTDISIAIIGRPNVGKSSLLNALAGEERVIVSEVPHTTKEPQDTLLTYTTPEGEKQLLLIDTVGIRKKSNVGPGLEKLGVHLSLTALAQADVVLLIIDAESGIGAQEKKLADLVGQSDAGLLIVVNKWDVSAANKLGTTDDYSAYVRRELPFLDWADIVFISAKTHKGIGQIIEHALAIQKSRSMEVPAEKIDAFVERLKKIHGKTRPGANKPKVYGISQTGTQPPRFILVAQDKDTLHHNYLKFVANRMRDEFGFIGTPLKVNGREIAKGRNGENRGMK